MTKTKQNKKNENKARTKRKTAIKTKKGEQKTKPTEIIDNNKRRRRQEQKQEIGPEAKMQTRQTKRRRK